MEAAFALAIIFVIMWAATHVQADTPETPKFSKERLRYMLSEESKGAPKGVAKRKSKLVKCGVAAKPCPMYMSTPELRTRAQVLVAELALGREAIAAHMEAKRQGVSSPIEQVDTIIAGVVRNRKELKKLEYDQPF
jgi:hypothetical protein